MNTLKTAALGLAMLTLAGGAAFAQSGGAMMKSDGAMKTDSMAAKPMAMSAKDMKTMKSCNAMSHDMMMKNKTCMTMSKMHPDMMKGDGMMKHDDAMSSDSMMKK
jgi:hypothetical protein